MSVADELETTDVESLSREAARDEAAALTERILALREDYYAHDAAVSSDAEYDALMHRLEAIEHAFPELQGQDSPTQTVGGRAQTSLFDPVTHAERMLSLDNVFSREEFLEWAARVERLAGQQFRDDEVPNGAIAVQ